MKIIGIDPSGSFKKYKGITGVAFVYCVDGNPKIRYLDTINNALFDSHEEMIAYYIGYFKKFDKEDVTIVIEDYIKNPAKEGLHKQGIEETTQLIGTLQGIFEHATVVMQMNTNIHQGDYPRNGLFGLSNLLKYGYVYYDDRDRFYYNTDKSAEVTVRWYASKKHMQDALAHALYYLIKQDVDIYKIKKDTE